MINGTIIFYNLDDGSGMILAQDKQKYKFDIEMWDDFDNMPSIGLKVTLEFKDKVLKSIVRYKDLNIIEDMGEEESGNFSSIDNFSGDLENGKLNVESYSVKSVPKDFIEVTMTKFFSSLQDTVGKYKGYQLQSDEEELDYMKIKRFLFTAYNNLLEIDISLADGSLTEMYRHIQEIHSIHDIYKKSFMYPKIAFTTIFLKHTRYKEAKSRLEKNISEMTIIKANLNVMEKEIKQKIKDLGAMEKDDEEIVPLKQNIKHVKRLYVDAIDRVGTLREENEMLLPVTNEYFELFFEEFKQKFESSYEENIRSLLKILDSMAFLFDRMMWEKASSSVMIDRYFKAAIIDYPYSCLTFLKYYLKSLNKSKLTPENQELFALLAYLEKRSKKK